jgi:hypothetical protein
MEFVNRFEEFFLSDRNPWLFRRTRPPNIAVLPVLSSQLARDGSSWYNLVLLVLATTD